MITCSQQQACVYNAIAPITMSQASILHEQPVRISCCILAKPCCVDYGCKYCPTLQKQLRQIVRHCTCTKRGVAGVAP